jgi:hypothetical protein
MTEQGACVHCGDATPAQCVEFCQNCLLYELKLRAPKIKFLKADGTETQDAAECVVIQGIKLKERKK